MLKELITAATADTRDIYDVSEAVLGVLSQARRKYPDQLIAYVAGAITADGYHKIKENGQLLACRASKVRQVHPLTFSAPDIFSQEVYDRINGLDLHRDEYIHFFRKKLRSGFINVVYMTRGWRRSEGSRDEHDTAEQLGIHIVDMEPILFGGGYDFI